MAYCDRSMEADRCGRNVQVEWREEGRNVSKYVMDVIHLLLDSTN